MKFFLLLNCSIVALAGDCSEKKKCYRQCQQMANDMMRDCLNWYPGELKWSLIWIILYDIISNKTIFGQNDFEVLIFRFWWHRWILWGYDRIWAAEMQCSAGRILKNIVNLEKLFCLKFNSHSVGMRFYYAGVLSLWKPFSFNLLFPDLFWIFDQKWPW